MDSTRIDAERSEQTQEHAYTYAGYHSIITGVDRSWEYGGFALPDGSFWRYREPDAAVIVEADRLLVTVGQLTRSNDYVQVLDNAKNMFFSTRQFTPLTVQAHVRTTFTMVLSR